MADHRAIAFLSATDVHSKLLSGELSLADVTSAIRQQIETVNPTVNAFDSLADRIEPQQDGPLKGLPISVKDQIHVAGLPCNFGLDKPPPGLCETTASTVQRLLDAGVSIIGKTNLPPFAMDYQSFNARTGWTNNPWNVDYSPGGSSGGSAAAVATGMSYLDIGADLAGSLRIPAAFCGVFSFLPSEGALQTDGMLAGGRVLRHFARIGPIARSVDDLMLAWKVLSATEPVETDLKDPRLAVYAPGTSGSVDERIERAFDDVASVLTAAGFGTAPFEGDSFINEASYQSYGEIMGYETGELIPPIARWMGRLLGRSSANRSPHFLRHVHSGQRLNRSRYEKALTARTQCRESFDTQSARYDALLLPVARVQTFKHRRPSSDRGGVRDYQEPFRVANQEVGYFDALTDFTTPVSLVGNPVVTLPLGLDDRGLPIGAQLIGKRNRDWDLLKLAKKLSTLLPNISLANVE